MEYEWDPAKAASNLLKHRVIFADAVAVFSDPFALTIPVSARKASRHERTLYTG